MRVNELIAKLELCNPDAKVMVAINDTDGCYLELVENSKDIVCLTGATDDF